MNNIQEKNEINDWNQKITSDHFTRKMLELKSLHSKIVKKNEIGDDLEIGGSLSQFRILSELGRGSYGVVYKCQSLIDNNDYVLKKINIKHLKPKQQNDVLKEVLILKKVKHANVIRYYNSFIEEDCLYIVMEYADGGDLQMFVRSTREKKKIINEDEIWSIAYETCKAVEYLHVNNIIHRDIKTMNVFLTQDRHVKLGDLGVSKIVSNYQLALQGTRVGTPLYLSPELVKQQPYDHKIDIWALGCVFYHMAALEPPFMGDNLITLGYNIVNKSPKPIPACYSSKLSNFIKLFLEKNSLARPKIAQIWEFFPQRDKIKKDKKRQTPQTENEIKTEELNKKPILSQNFVEEKKLQAENGKKPFDNLKSVLGNKNSPKILEDGISPSLKQQRAISVIENTNFEKKEQIKHQEANNNQDLLYKNFIKKAFKNKGNANDMHQFDLDERRNSNSGIESQRKFNIVNIETPFRKPQVRILENVSKGDPNDARAKSPHSYFKKREDFLKAKNKIFNGLQNQEEIKNKNLLKNTPSSLEDENSAKENTDLQKRQNSQKNVFENLKKDYVLAENHKQTNEQIKQRPFSTKISKMMNPFQKNKEVSNLEEENRNEMNLNENKKIFNLVRPQSAAPSYNINKSKSIGFNKIERFVHEEPTKNDNKSKNNFNKNEEKNDSNPQTLKLISENKQIPNNDFLNKNMNNLLMVASPKKNQGEEEKLISARNISGNINSMNFFKCFSANNLFKQGGPKNINNATTENKRQENDSEEFIEESEETKVIVSVNKARKLFKKPPFRGEYIDSKAFSMLNKHKPDKYKIELKEAPTSAAQVGNH